MGKRPEDLPEMVDDDVHLMDRLAATLPRNPEDSDPGQREAIAAYWAAANADPTQFHGNPQHRFLRSLRTLLSDLPSEQKRQSVVVRGDVPSTLSFDDVADISNARREVNADEVKAIADWLKLPTAWMPEEEWLEITQAAAKHSDRVISPHKHFVKDGDDFIKNRENLRRVREVTEDMDAEERAVPVSVPAPVRDHVSRLLSRQETQGLEAATNSSDRRIPSHDQITLTEKDYELVRETLDNKHRLGKIVRAARDLLPSHKRVGGVQIVREAQKGQEGDAELVFAFLQAARGVKSRSR